MYLLVLYIGISTGIKYTIISFIIYAIGISFYIYVRRQFAPHEKVFTKTEIGFRNCYCHCSNSRNIYSRSLMCLNEHLSKYYSERYLFLYIKIYFIIKVVKVFLHLLTVLLLVINELLDDMMCFR